MRTVVLCVLLISVLPIWRDPAVEGGVSFWEFMAQNAMSSKTHIPYDEALSSAQDVYLRNWMLGER